MRLWTVEKYLGAFDAAKVQVQTRIEDDACQLAIAPSSQIDMVFAKPSDGEVCLVGVGAPYPRHPTGKWRGPWFVGGPSCGQSSAQQPADYTRAPRLAALPGAESPVNWSSAWVLANTLIGDQMNAYNGAPSGSEITGPRLAIEIHDVPLLSIPRARPPSKMAWNNQSSILTSTAAPLVVIPCQGRRRVSVLVGGYGASGGAAKINVSVSGLMLGAGYASAGAFGTLYDASKPARLVEVAGIYTATVTLSGSPNNLGFTVSADAYDFLGLVLSTDTGTCGYNVIAETQD